MKIKIKNTILVEGQKEVIENAYQGEVIQKKDNIYLSYVDEEERKNVIKIGADSLVLTRFSNPKTKMEFRLGQAPATIITPVGIQELVTETRAFRQGEGLVELDYSLLQNNLKFADYKLEIRFSL
ncbi:DUF1934 domain-containing protein [Streptococcaceae bacterium ESL0687]|nr:DUF1934 domain-containing protein [Streptococcaceae bacterium ESL0687]